MGLMWRSSLLLASAGLFVALNVPAIAQTSGSDPASASKMQGSAMAGKVSAADTKFAKEAASGGLLEVELGRLATQKATSDKVKTFGQRMADDHGKANDELKAIASKDGITLPTQMDAKDRATVNKLSNMSGEAFERAYMRDMVADHQHDLAAFQKESTSGSNMDLKNWAATTMPTLQEHLRLAKDAEASLGAMSQK